MGRVKNLFIIDGTKDIKTIENDIYNIVLDKLNNRKYRGVLT